MTIIAYDGKTVATDRQATDNGLRQYAKKLFKMDDGTVIAISGDMSLSIALKDWYVAGKPEDKCPCSREKDKFGYIIVFKPDGTVEEYENCDTPIEVIDPFMAWGSGRNYAIAAMGLGKTAEEAVLEASRYDVFCGMGVDVVDLSHTITENKIALCLYKLKRSLNK